MCECGDIDRGEAYGWSMGSQVGGVTVSWELV